MINFCQLRANETYFIPKSIGRSPGVVFVSEQCIWQWVLLPWIKVGMVRQIRTKSNRELQVANYYNTILYFSWNDNKYICRKRILLQSDKTRNDIVNVITKRKKRKKRQELCYEWHGKKKGSRDIQSIIWYHHRYAQESIGKVNRSMQERKEQWNMRMAWGWQEENKKETMVVGSDGIDRGQIIWWETVTYICTGTDWPKISVICFESWGWVD